MAVRGQIAGLHLAQLATLYHDLAAELGRRHDRVHRRDAEQNSARATPSSLALPG
jgi:hypothetical protein